MDSKEKNKLQVSDKLGEMQALLERFKELEEEVKSIKTQRSNKGKQAEE